MRLDIGPESLGAGIEGRLLHSSWRPSSRCSFEALVRNGTDRSQLSTSSPGRKRSWVKVGDDPWSVTLPLAFFLEEKKHVH